MSANKSDKKAIPRTEKGYFIKGQAPVSPGRPPGSISVIGKIKQKFAENPEYFDEWVNEYLADKNSRRAIAESIDGKPTQAIDITTKGQAINSMAELPTEELERITTEGTG